MEPCLTHTQCQTGYFLLLLPESFYSSDIVLISPLSCYFPGFVSIKGRIPGLGYHFSRRFPVEEEEWPHLSYNPCHCPGTESLVALLLLPSQIRGFGFGGVGGRRLWSACGRNSPLPLQLAGVPF